MFDFKIITLFPVYYWFVRDNIISEWEKNMGFIQISVLKHIYIYNIVLVLVRLCTFGVFSCKKKKTYYFDHAQKVIYIVGLNCNSLWNSLIV